MQGNSFVTDSFQEENGVQNPIMTVKTAVVHKRKRTSLKGKTLFPPSVIQLGVTPNMPLSLPPSCFSEIQFLSSQGQKEHQRREEYVIC